MILFIDDCPRRRARFKEAFGGSPTVADSFFVAGLALTLWPDGDFTTIYLDIDGVEGDRIADRAIDTGLHQSAKWIIHSGNMALAPQVRDRLVAAGYDAELKSFEEIVG